MKFSDYIKENNCRTESIDNTKNTIHENDQKYNDIKKHLDEYSKYSSNELMNEELNYFNQEKQMTFLIDDDDETFKNQIKDIIKGLINSTM